MVPRETGRKTPVPLGTGFFVSGGRNVRLAMTKGDTEKHWTHRLFVDNAGLYLPFLIEALGLSDVEVIALAGLFA